MHAIDDQFMCGANILVAPVMREDSRRTFYLPEGLWHDFFSKECAVGRQWITQDCPPDSIPIWLRGGSIIPFGPVVQSTSELADDTPLELVNPLDQEKKASGLFHVNKKSASMITAESKDGQVLVTIGKGLCLEKIRVFAQTGEIFGQNVMLKQIDDLIRQ